VKRGSHVGRLQRRSSYMTSISAGLGSLDHSIQLRNASVSGGNLPQDFGFADKEMLGSALRHMWRYGSLPPGSRIRAMPRSWEGCCSMRWYIDRKFSLSYSNPSLVLQSTAYAARTLPQIR
jgi:hypothetical protein